MYKVVQEGDKFTFYKADSRLQTPGGSQVYTAFKPLAQKLLKDLMSYGEDPSDPISYVPKKDLRKFMDNYKFYFKLEGRSSARVMLMDKLLIRPQIQEGGCSQSAQLTFPSKKFKDYGKESINCCLLRTKRKVGAAAKLT